MNILIVSIFILGYIAIALEYKLQINKAATAILTGGLCWIVYILFTPDKHVVIEQLEAHLGELSGILFFLLAAMTIVELIDAHDGFNIITDNIKQTNKTALLWIIGMLTFFLSSLLDNLTSTIVMITLLRKLIKSDKARLYFSGIVVIAANAGGAWSPIGDITTTMLWIDGQITATNIVTSLFFPSIMCLIVPLIIVSLNLKGQFERPEIINEHNRDTLTKLQQKIVLFSGMGIFILVPIFKTMTHLPPYIGILMGLGILWVITEILHSNKDSHNKHNLTVVSAIQKIDTPSILFFLGILLSIAALESTGILNDLARFLSTNIKNDNIIVFSIGLLSSIIDNVPLVAAVQGMFTLDQYHTDHYFWEFLAYCTGTGGSVLIIGSAAGVAAAGMEKISFFWYLKKLGWLALIGYCVGAMVYFLQRFFV